ncbi:hypothetical protein BBP40_002514 [Aspergillus hancockii]|nr:hypothetical protein BBP40_002514 [Aspergillus hancockii]
MGSMTPESVASNNNQVQADSQEFVSWLRENMAALADKILDTQKIVFLVGDITRSDFGLQQAEIDLLRREVTVIFHAAADIALNSDLIDAVERNCLPTLRLAQMATSFGKLLRFVPISTAYVNSFLPDGMVVEQLYKTANCHSDPEVDLQSVCELKDSRRISSFPWPYAFAKHLMERLLFHRHPKLPIVVIRPTAIGPAIYHPFPLYGPKGSNPLTTFAELYLKDLGGTRLWHAAKGQSSGTNVLDEIPVDLVANICLLHTAANSTGVVHAAAQLYIPRTFDDFLRSTQSNAPPAIRDRLPGFVFTEDRSRKQCELAELFKVATRDWQFDCGRSSRFKGIKTGPLSLNLGTHDILQFDQARLVALSKQLFPEVVKIVESLHHLPRTLSITS